MAGKSLNKVQLIGNLGKDPELKYTANGTAVATFSMATGRKQKNPTSGEWEDATDWHNIVVWQKPAEIAATYLSKGSKAYIEGRLQTRTWDDQQGVKHYITEIVAQNLITLSGSSGGGGDRPPHPGDVADAPTHTGAPQATTPVGLDDEPF